MSDPFEEPVISLRKVSKAYGTYEVLKDLNFDIAPREYVSLIGPSGSGKSTILRTLITLEDVQKGDIHVDGDYLWQDPGQGSIQAKGAKLSAIRQKFGMVFQSFNLFPHMTAIRNIAEAPIRVLGMKREEALERAQELLKMVGLSHKADSYPIQLSGGQQQRIAIARTLAMRPKILLFDEVTSALDPETIGEVVDVIRMLAKEHDFTVLMVTHQMSLAKELSDRIFFLEGGRILEQGTPEQILQSPHDERTKAFLKAVLAA